MNKTIKRILIIGGLLAVLLALVLPKLDLAGSDENADVQDGQEAPLGIRVEVVTPTRLSDRLYTTGTLRANEEVELVAEAAGKVTGIFFEEGTQVQAGNLLVKINDAELEAQRARTKYRLELAQEQSERRRQLLDRGGVSQEDYDQVLNEVNVLQSELQLIDAQIAKTEIRAPFSGTIGLRYVSEGSYVSPQSRIATLQDVDPIKIDFTVPEKYAGSVRLGADVGFTVANTIFSVEGTPQQFQGQIYAVEPRINENTRTLQVRARGPNQNGILLPGAFANIELIVQEIEDALMVPAIAVVPDLEGKKVFVYHDGQAQPQSVQTGLRTDSTVQVTSGLSPGDTVITSGIQSLRPGLPVQLTNVN